MGSDREVSKYMGGHSQSAGKRSGNSKTRRGSTKARSRSDHTAPRLEEAPTTETSAPRDVAGPPEIYVPPGSAESSVAPSSSPANSIRNEVAAVRTMETEFFQSRDDVVLRLERCLETLQGLEDDLARQSGQVTRSRKDVIAALDQVTAIREEDWDSEAIDSEYAHAMRVIDDARMEWKRCALRWPEIKRGQEADPLRLEDGSGAPLAGIPLTQHNMAYLCRMGFAMTWPIGLALLIVGLLFILF